MRIRGQGASSIYTQENWQNQSRPNVQRYRYKARRRSPSCALIFLILGLAAIVMMGAIFMGTQGLLPVRDPGFLQRQAGAMLPSHSADLLKLAGAPRYTLYATADPYNLVAYGTLVLQYTNLTGIPLDELVFRLYPNASSIYGGGSLTVSRVSADGQDLTNYISEDATTLTVVLPATLPPRGSVEVEIDFQDQVPEGDSQGYGIYGQAQGVFSLAGWYPVLAPYQNGWQIPEIPAVGDALMAETSLYEVFLTAPNGFTLVSTGSVLKRSEDEQNTTWQIVSGPAREFALALSDQFVMHETQAGGVKLRMYSLPLESPANALVTGLEIMKGAFETYQTDFGPYPFKEFELYESVITIGGYEFSGMVTVSPAERENDSPADYRYIMAHEIAHQWWYGLVGNETVTEPWLDEANATYAVALYLEKARGAESAGIQINYWYNNFGPLQPGEPPIDSSALEFSDWPSYNKTIYMQGALFIDALRQDMGDRQFFRFLRSYQSANRYKIGSTQEYLQMAEQIAGRDLSPTYSAWISQIIPATGQDRENQRD